MLKRKIKRYEQFVSAFQATIEALGVDKNASTSVAEVVRILDRHVGYLKEDLKKLEE